MKKQAIDYIGERFFEAGFHSGVEEKEVMGIKEGRYVLRNVTKDTCFGEALIPLEEIDTYLAHAVGSVNEFHERAEKYKQALAREKSALEEYENTDGFADDFSPMQRGKIRKALAKHIRYHGHVSTLKNFIRLKAKEGWIVNDGKMIAPTGVFLLARDLPSTWGLQYLTHLNNTVPGV